MDLISLEVDFVIGLVDLVSLEVDFILVADFMLVAKWVLFLL